MTQRRFPAKVTPHGRLVNIYRCLGRGFNYLVLPVLLITCRPLCLTLLLRHAAKLGALWNGRCHLLALASTASALWNLITLGI